MADPNKFKSISVPIEAYKKAVFLTNQYTNKHEIKLSISKIIELIITKEAKKKGYKNGKET